jgi:hypothetical protein
VACAEKDRHAVNQGETSHLRPLPFELGVVTERWRANNNSEAITTEPCYIGDKIVSHERFLLQPQSIQTAHFAHYRRKYSASRSCDPAHSLELEIVGKGVLHRPALVLKQSD